ncbi:LAMI_0G06414g1_1 [Lachancea mirantina]|uniref:LAMI_0G06414g1_1 n=1 Tax=Lachancea mirantina TaxID=1230905 RepID=A0A1G4K979_9SACH|nr:LAMI_0G06414g1_1 [Lachancea mirantina]
MVVYYIRTLEIQRSKPLSKKEGGTSSTTMRGGSIARFSRVHDAAQYVNDQLRARNLVADSQRLCFASVDDTQLGSQLARIQNDKLVINTIHKLLQALADAESAIEEVSHGESQTPIPAVAAAAAPAAAASVPRVARRVSKPRPRQTIAAARRQQLALEQLRARVADPDRDRTWWCAESSLARPDETELDADHVTSAPSPLPQAESRLLRRVLEREHLSELALRNLATFLHDANGFLYTRCVHQCERELPKRIDLASEDTDGIADVSETTDAVTLRLQELVNDWHDIAALL